MTVPVPALRDQRRIAAALTDVAVQLEEAKRLRRDSLAKANALVVASIGDVLGRYPADGALSDVLTGKPRNGWSAPCDNADGGVAVLSLGAVTGFTYRPTEFKRTSEPTTPSAHYWLTPGDLLMTRSNTEQLVGHAAIYTGEPSPCIYPDLMMRVPVDPTLADVRFVHYWLRTQGIREIIERAGSGTSSTMKKITQGDVLGLPFPSGTSMSEQVSAVRRLDSLVSEVESLSSEQTRVASDLEAVFPSILDRAFLGSRTGEAVGEGS
jgi:type I restriction enzyme, S subunit